MNEASATFIFIVILLLGTAVIFQLQKIRSAKARRRRIREQWGELPDPDLSAEEYESVSLYHEEHAGDAFRIDDTTWNDLSMDRIFGMMNAAQSSCGEDVLYHFLRTPGKDPAVLSHREEVMAYFASHPQEREDVQFLLASVGRKRHMSYYAYMRELEDAEPVRMLFYIGLLVLAVANIALFFIRPVAAVVMLIALLSVNIALKMRNDRRIRLYLQSMSCILQMTQVSRRLSKMNVPVISEELSVLADCAKEMAPFTRGSVFVTSAGQVGNGPADVIMDYLKMYFHVDMLKFNQMLSFYRKHKEGCDRMLTALGTIDALIAAASFRELLPVWCPWTPEEGKEDLEILGMYHPLIPDPVKNDVRLAGGNLVTGSNASGKSTFLRNTALCVILAESVLTVPAGSYRAPFLKVMSSMALTDDLAAKESYFIVELKSVRRILREAEKEGMVFALVDEVLRGTNTTERIAASTEILRLLAGKKNVMFLAATHDGELTEILSDCVTNWHFEEQIEEHGVVFDYRLREGPARTRNAIALLSVMDFPAEVVEGARRRAEEFDRSGHWLSGKDGR